MQQCEILPSATSISRCDKKREGKQMHSLKLLNELYTGILLFFLRLSKKFCDLALSSELEELHGTAEATTQEYSQVLLSPVLSSFRRQQHSIICTKHKI
jgi:hypothetical protein